jgi:DNA-binding CsgD family transcriptional regulator
MLEGPSSRVQVYLQVAERAGLARTAVVGGLLADGPLPPRVPFVAMMAILDRMAHLLGGGPALEAACATFAQPPDLAYLAHAFDSQRAFSRFVCEQLSPTYYAFAPTTHEDFDDGTYRETMTFPRESNASLATTHALVGFVRGHARLRGLPENDVRVASPEPGRVELLITPPTESSLDPCSGRRILPANETTAATVRAVLAARGGLGDQRRRFARAVETLSAPALVGAPLEEYLAIVCATLRDLLELPHCAIWHHAPLPPSSSTARLLTWIGSPPPWLESRRLPLCFGYEVDVPLGTDVSAALPLFSWVARRVERSSFSGAPSLEGLARQWGLSQRQLAVLRLLVAGHANPTIAAALGCAVGTVEQHVGAVLARSGLSSRAAVLRACLVGEESLAPPPPARCGRHR